MIICFSGTGNSRRVADQMQDALGDELVRFAPGLMNKPELIKVKVTDGRIIWIMPVHCWNLPRVVNKIIKKMHIAAKEPVVHHLVFTCGDDIGYADVVWRKHIESRGWKTGSVFSIQAPNNYVFLPGFDVDPRELANEKLEKMGPRVEEIIDTFINEETKTDVVRGSWPWTKTYVLQPLFKLIRWSPRPFHATDACVGCGRCAHNCPLTNIQMVNGRPAWGSQCTMCSRCYHCCPQHAVQYGSSTKNKGQYMCPGYILRH